jgi:hypothetical protein
VVIVAIIYGIGITMALLTGAAIGLLLTVTHYQRVAAERQRYEEEVARDPEFRAAAVQAVLHHYGPTWPRS